MPYWHSYPHWSCSTWWQRIVPVSEWYPQVCLLYVYGNDSVTKLSVTGQASHVFHADFFPWLVTYDVKSHPVNAWKNNNHLAIWGHSADAISWIWMCLKSLLVPNSIQSCSMFGKPWKWAMTSLSTVLIITDLKPQFMASLTWRSIRVSASSCRHGCWNPSALGTGRVHPYCHHFVRPFSSSLEAWHG